MSKIFGIIPSRYASTRFPGKPLALIGPPPKKPMFLRVYEQSCLCSELDKVILATDSDRIAQVAERNKVPYIMTKRSHVSGTDRVLEAARKMNINDDDIIIGIQGDQPALHPEMLSQIVEPFKDPKVQVTTLIRDDRRDKFRKDPDSAKIVIDKFNDMLYMSRRGIPFDHQGTSTSYYIHVGICAFRLYALNKFAEFGPSILESVEGLEQLRFIENGIPIRTVKTKHVARGVDRPEDIPIVEKILMER